MRSRSCSRRRGHCRRRRNCRALACRALRACCGKGGRCGRGRFRCRRIHGRCFVRIRRSLRIHKTDILGRPLPGAVFHLICRKGKVIRTAVTNIAGEAILCHIPPGEYLLREVRSPIGFCPTCHTRRICITRNGRLVVDGRVLLSNRLRIVNEPIRAGFSFRKTGEGTPLAGAVFELLIPSTLTTVRSATSDAEGVVTFSNVPPGTYLLKEVSAPSPFVPSSQVFPVVVAQSGAVTISGIPAVALRDFTINDTMVTTTTRVVTTQIAIPTLTFFLNNELGDPVPGVEFGIYDTAGNLVETQFTDIDGEITFTSLPVGTFVLQEVDPAQRNLSLTIQVDAGGTVQIDGLPYTTFNGTTFINLSSPLAIEPFSLEFFKADPQGNPIFGATFAIIDHCGFQLTVAQSDENGFVSFSNLTPGRFCLVELCEAPGFIPTRAKFDVVVFSTGEVFVDGVTAAVFASRALINCPESRLLNFPTLSGTQPIASLQGAENSTPGFSFSGAEEFIKNFGNDLF